MPTKYCDRLVLPSIGSTEISFSTKNGLKIATGYRKVILEGKPLIEFADFQINKENITIPQNQKWRTTNKLVEFIEYRSRDYCNIKILKKKSNGKFYISPFDLSSNKFPILIQPLKRRKTSLI
jgi:hypothetical protein